MSSLDKLSGKILDTVKRSEEPLETTEIISQVHDTRTKVIYRLYQLRGDGLVKGKQVGSGKKTWIWWKNEQ